MDTVIDAVAHEFRALMSGFPSGVVVVTTIDAAGKPTGLTCSSLCSVSLDPPLLLVCIANRSHTLDAISARGLFAVNMLHSDGRTAAQVFSQSTPDRFRALPLSRTPQTGMPCLAEHAHAVAECRVRSTHVAGDHTIVVGEVLWAGQLCAAPPLLYGLREYASWPAARSPHRGEDR